MSIVLTVRRSQAACVIEFGVRQRAEWLIKLMFPSCKRNVVSIRHDVGSSRDVAPSIPEPWEKM